MSDRKSDLLLINAFSWTTERRACYLPYGILYLAGFLRQKGIKVDIYDRNTDFSLNIQNCLYYVQKIKPAIVGLSVLTGPVISDALKISRAIKSVSPGTTVVWGGLHPTIFPNHVLGEESVDFIIQGEGELAGFELCRALLDNGPYGHIKNLGFKDKGRIVLNPMRDEMLDLDTNDMPAWDLLDIEHYVANRFFANRVLTMNTSRGCPFKCAFCFNQGLPYQRWRGLSAPKIKKQIDYLHDNYRINGIQFYEDSFDTDKKRVRDFCRLMRDSGMSGRIKWSHFSNIPYFDHELVSYEKSSGLRYIEYGVESGSQRILDAVDKRQTIPQIKEV
ncbi:MAG: radical SAM protein, partial [Candidatus Omnitrophota bacterium]